jgi:hypothetical protein
MQENRGYLADQPHFPPVREFASAFARFGHRIAQALETLDTDTIPVSLKLRSASLVVKPGSPGTAQVKGALLITGKVRRVSLRSDMPFYPRKPHAVIMPQVYDK